MKQAESNHIKLITKKLDEACLIEFGTRVVQKKDGGAIYSVYGGGGATFKMDTHNRENCLVVSRFAMSKKCTRFVSGKFYLNDSGLTVKPKNINELRQEYLDYLLLALNDTIYSLSRGTAQRNLNVSKFRNIEIQYPDSIDAQLHIAEILSKAENLIAQRKESIRLLDEFLKSTFLEMFGDPIKNKKRWDEKKLGELCVIRRGASPRPISDFIGTDIPWIKIGDGTKGNDLYIENTAVSVTIEGSLKSVLLEEGSLVFANCGVSLGFARILKIKGCIHDGWLSFEKIKENLNKIFLLKLLNNSTEYLRRIAPDGTQPNLNTGIMKSFKVILPPLERQNQFAQIVEKTEALKTQYQQSLQELENLYGSLSQRAFKGELSYELKKTETS